MDAILLADFAPGTLTAFYIALGGGILAAVCLGFAGFMFLTKEPRAGRRLLFVAGLCVLLGVGLCCLAVLFGQRLGLL